MGLDMYLSKKTYVKQWSFKKPEDQFKVSVKKGGVTYSNIKPKRVSYITEELMYWRKANQIHGWFINNTEEIVAGIRYYVTKTDLEVLLETCKKVVEILNKTPKVTKQVVGGWKDGEEFMVDIEMYDNDVLVGFIKSILPPTDGFFFGSDVIDDYYKENIVDTIKFLEEELPNCEKSDEFEYYASW
jgi:hypothetical protein